MTEHVAFTVAFAVIASWMVMTMAVGQMRTTGEAWSPSWRFAVTYYAISLPLLGGAYWYLTR